MFLLKITVALVGVRNLIVSLKLSEKCHFYWRRECPEEYIEGQSHLITKENIFGKINHIQKVCWEKLPGIKVKSWVLFLNMLLKKDVFLGIVMAMGSIKVAVDIFIFLNLTIHLLIIKVIFLNIVL